MSPSRTVTLNLRDHRTDPDSRAWELPPWGHSASMMVMPLFLNIKGHFFPIGSAFTVGRGMGLIMSALHNIMEAVAREPRFDRARSQGTMPAALTLQSVGLSVLHQVPNESDSLTLNFLPLGSVEGAPPTDIVIGSVRMPERTATLSVPLSFAIPDQGDTVWSLGYSDFRFPKGGIPAEDIVNGRFAWHKHYSHRFKVVEAQVQAAFTGRFASGFVDGPCFAFDETITHGMSGGPVLSESGYLVGINSAGAENFFGRPMAIASMLYPLLLTNVRFGGTFGPLTINGRRSLLELIAVGSIGTDGSEERIGYSELDNPDGAAIHATAPIAHQAIYDDFAGYQSNSRATSVPGPLYHFLPKDTGPEI